MDRPINVLIIEDNPADYELLQRFLLKTDTKFLTDATFYVKNATSISAAKLDLLKNTVDIILLDLSHPDRYGLSAVATLRKMAPSIPVVILTGVPDEKWALQVIKNGAQDYLIKGEINRHQLIRAIYYAIERHQRDETLRKTTEALSTFAAHMEALYQTSLEINSQLDLKLLLSSIVERAVKMAGVSTGLLYLLPPGEDYLELVIGYNLPEQFLGEKLPIGQGLSGKVAQTGELKWVPDYQNWEGRLSYFSSSTFRQSLSVPLKFHGKTIGVIDMSDIQATGPFTEDQIHLTKLFADQAAIAIENARLYSETQQQAITDELTGLYNRRGLAQLGNREVQRSQRFGNPLSAIVIDIDFFKHINDNYGHPAGDAILKTLANRLRENLRSLDIIARTGGDEFVILLLENDQAAALNTGERLKANIMSKPFHTEFVEIQISLSMGVAGATGATQDLTMLLGKADQALYLAKGAGRNRVFQYSE
jgi:diguanylate cyclase (GGDEF)-like protein